MAEDSDETQNVEFISAQDDAAVRLECFRLADRGAIDFSSHIAQAQRLYNWVMDYEDTTDEVVVTTGESPCTRKH
jgi:hypothetical protein